MSDPSTCADSRRLTQQNLKLAFHGELPEPSGQLAALLEKLRQAREGAAPNPSSREPDNR